MLHSTRERGFTLVELAIVLVIIGIILGAILKGQELINNARVKRLQNDLRGVESLVWAFYDRYGRFPGDCNRDGRMDPAVSTSSEGVLDNDPASAFCPDTSFYNDLDFPWAELKQAKLLPSASYNWDLARHIFSGNFYMGVANAGGSTPYVNAIAAVDIPCFAAKVIDSSIDGTIDAGAGRVRELTDVATAASGSSLDWSCTSEEQLVDLVYFFDKLPD